MLPLSPKKIAIFIVSATLLGLVIFFSAQILSKRPFSVSSVNPKPGSCLVLEEKYCKQGTAVYYKDKFVGVGFKLPKNTPLFSPFLGNFNYSNIKIRNETKAPIYLGIGIRDASSDQHTFNAYFLDIKVDQNKNNAAKGEIIGSISDKELDFFGPYNLLVYFSKINTNKFFSVDKESTLKNFKL